MTAGALHASACHLKERTRNMIFRHGRGTPQLPEFAGGHLENGCLDEKSGSPVDRSAPSSNTPRAERPHAVLPAKSIFGGSKVPDASHPSPWTEHGKEEDSDYGDKSTLQADVNSWKVKAFEDTMRGFSQLAPPVLLCVVNVSSATRC